MPREKENYDKNRQALCERFGNVGMIRLSQAAEYIGTYVDALYRDKDFPKKKIGGRWYVSIPTFASWLS